MEREERSKKGSDAEKVNWLPILGVGAHSRPEIIHQVEFAVRSRIVGLHLYSNKQKVVSGAKLGISVTGI